MHLGIDLGTSNSAVVGLADGRTTLFKTADGADVLPSAIYRDKRGRQFVGKAAQDRLLLGDGASVASGFKRLMGTRTPIPFGTESWTPEQCSAEIIRTLVAQARTEGGDAPIEGTVVTIPAAFNQMQSEATRDAARMAGLDKVGLLQEPVAAALASIANSRQRDGVFLVYDLGGGTFDVALVTSTGGAATVVAHEGINMLGGRDFDRAVLDALVRPWLLDTFDLPADFQAQPRFRGLIPAARAAIERAKIQLSTVETASIFASETELRITDEAGEDVYISVDLSRRQLSDLVRPKVEESVALCRKVIADQGYAHEDISRVVPIGGPSKMPIVRDLLRDGLAIEVEQGLDPMTAVAVGAAIFAEGRRWDEEGSTRKPSARRETVGGDLPMTLDFSERVSDDTAPLRIKVGGSVAAGHEVEVRDETGTTVSRMALQATTTLRLPLRRAGENRFRVGVWGPDGSEVPSLRRDLIITRTLASAAAVPMTYTLAVKVQEGVVGDERNRLETLCEKGTLLPAEGQKSFRSAKTLKGGDDDAISMSFYEMRDGLDDPSLNLHIGDFRLRSRDHLEAGERIKRGAEMVVRWRMSDNSTLSFVVDVPDLGRSIEAPDLYNATAGLQDFEGQEGASAAEALLLEAERELDALDDVLGGEADRGGALRRRLNEHHASLNASAEADTHRSVANEARRLRQEVALLRLKPENEEKVLSREVSDAEVEFDKLRAHADDLEASRHDRLLVEARRCIRERDFDAARTALKDMQGIRFGLLLDQPEFLVGVFANLADEGYMAVDDDLHERLVAEGMAAAKARDTKRLRSVIQRLIGNRFDRGGQAEGIVGLADLLRG